MLPGQLDFTHSNPPRGRALGHAVQPSSGTQQQRIGSDDLFLEHADAGPASSPDRSFFDSVYTSFALRYITIDVCLCSPAALQLLLRGLFPCAPQAPTLAIDLNLLHFVQQVFVRMPPNTTSFCATLESFLGDRGYKLLTRDSSRRRFGNALLWYSSLVNSTSRHVQDAIEQARCTLRPDPHALESCASPDAGDSGARVVLTHPAARASLQSRSSSHSHSPSCSLAPSCSPSCTLLCSPSRTPSCSPSHTPSCSPSRTPLLSSSRSGVHSPSPSRLSLPGHSPSHRCREQRGESDGTHSQEQDLQRPSEYLRARCPLCFGGTSCRHGDDIPDVIVCIDACFTQKQRKGKADAHDHPRDSERSVFVPEEDVKAMESFVENIHPSDGKKARCARPTVLDEEDSYEGDLKIPTQFFTDTGLMALLCRHDRVLWLVNMTSAGERQHYTLTLVRRLFQHLPPHMSVGILYDIACQLHRSCIKWGFLDDLLSRISFATSIFHAYGHQWPCQLIYHPRNSIRKLIPSLRVSGYHQRLFVLDTQVKHLDQQSTFSLGLWLRKKWSQCQAKKHLAAEALSQCGVDDDELCEEWAAQVCEQTKPAPRRSRNKAKRAIEVVLALQKTLDLYRETVRNLELKQMSDNAAVFDFQDIDLQLDDARSRVTSATRALQCKRAALSVDEQTQLTCLANNAFLCLRMNVRAIKQRIRDRLHQRKFELKHLERSYRHTVNNNKLSTHAESSIKHCEPGILRLTKTYNELCKQMDTLIKQRKAPHFAVAPQPIQSNGLFKLDVDDDIWQDVGLDDEQDVVEVPRWLGDDAVREGIKNRLLLDRCLEEEDWLQEERCSLQEWFEEEWQTLDADFMYQLDHRREELCRLCVIWQAQLHQDLVNAAGYEMTGSWDEDGEGGVQSQGSVQGAADDDNEDEVSFEEVTDAEDDGDLLDAAEVAALTDAYHSSTVDIDSECLACDDVILGDKVVVNRLIKDISCTCSDSTLGYREQFLTRIGVSQGFIREIFGETFDSPGAPWDLLGMSRKVHVLDWNGSLGYPQLLGPYTVVCGLALGTTQDALWNLQDSVWSVPTRLLELPIAKRGQPNNVPKSRCP
ncbi:hypothetical protein BKA93DRAFT_820642 [Sparassis latifolia]